MLMGMQHQLLSLQGTDEHLAFMILWMREHDPIAFATAIDRFGQRVSTSGPLDHRDEPRPAFRGVSDILS